MAHDFEGRVLRIVDEPPKLGVDEVFGNFIWGRGYPGAYAAVKRDGVFHPIPCRGYVGGHDGETKEFRFHNDAYGIVYAPIHASMTLEDVEGATYAYDDGTHWLFAHCSPHEQIDFATAVEQFTYATFQPNIDRALQLNTSTSMAQARALLDFAEQAGRDAFNTVRMATLGAYHRDPHHDHRRDLAHASIVKIWTAWQANTARLTDRNAISSIVGNVGARLRNDYIIEWRHERAPVWAEQGRDPVSGKEWCYTLAATADAITGDANLPDPNWHFDAFAVGGITRGTQHYTDGKQRPTEAKPWVVPFSRPLPVTGTPAPGVSMGSVAWTQGEAYKPAE